MTTTTNVTPLQITIPNPVQSAAKPASGQFWESDAPSFGDVLDTINPLQHIPIISSLYQNLTGDTQSTGAKLAGGALFGGPIGFFGSLIDTIVQAQTGGDIMSNMMAILGGPPVTPPPHSDSAPSQAVADANPSYMSPNQRASYNAYTRTQNLLS